MRGIIFRVYLNFIQDKFGYLELDKLLNKDDFPNKGGFSSGGNYESKFLFSLITNSKDLFNNLSSENIQEKFGEYTFPFLINKFRKIYNQNDSHIHLDNAYDFLESLDLIHSNEINKHYPKSIYEFPKFNIKRFNDEYLVIEYSSIRNLHFFALGLIKGCLNYFSNNSTVTMLKTDKTVVLSNKECNLYKFVVKNND